MIKAVLWDLGDVLCRFHPDRRVREIARCSGASENDVRALLTPELLARLDAGDLTGDQLLAAVHAHLGWHCTDHYRDLIPAVAEVVPIAVFSGRTRLVKPDALSFVNACAVLNAVPSDVLLIDDSATNVAAASGAGLRTHHYRSPDALETFLDQEHLLDS